eukprot:TRINITY_DN74884_c0_g1_i1.p1 TRINITY_DN74884_c0_g1~~TRINITY_DN74884_c0_g1_i1.p1  ORF type:complete len:298 (-),score=55.67 TRINITY_DN74884_c0_g1_i1:149-1042(-)
MRSFALPSPAPATPSAPRVCGSQSSRSGCRRGRTLATALALLLAPAAANASSAAGGQTPWWQVSSEENAKSLALYFDREARRYFVYTEGNIASSEKALSMYFNVARGPTVKNICEIGFNAGHSAAIYLNANPQANLYSFDIAQFKYTVGNLQLMKELFPERFDFIVGPSATAVPEFHQMKPDVKCDVISVDGDHSTEGTYADLVAMREMASCRNWVLMDDAGWKSTNAAWQKAKDEGILTQVECFVDMNPRPDYQFMDFPNNRSWCLGFFNIDDETCPKWFDESPNTEKTFVRPIEI